MYAMLKDMLLDKGKFSNNTAQHFENAAKNNDITIMKKIITESCSSALFIALKYKKDNVIKYLTDIGVELLEKHIIKYIIENGGEALLEYKLNYQITNKVLYTCLDTSSRELKHNLLFNFTEDKLELFFKMFENIRCKEIDYYILKIIIKHTKDLSLIDKLINLNSINKERILNCSINIENKDYIREYLLDNYSYSFTDINNACLIAIENSKLNIYKTLIDYQTNYFKKTYTDNNLIHYHQLIVACKDGYLDIAKYLVEEKKTSIIYNQSYLIRLACECGQLEIVKYLISKGENPTKYNNSCLKRAIINQNILLIEYLLSVNCDAQVCFYEGIKTNNIRILALLLRNGADINYNEGLALVHAVETSNIPLIKFLIKSGANVEIRSNYCLRFAAYKKNNKIIELLLNNGGNIQEAISKGNHTLRQIAAEYFKKSYDKLFHGPLPADSIECGICYNELTHIDKLYHCQICRKIVHSNCQNEWGTQCIYCRN